jgi:hypothetical protein
LKNVRSIENDADGQTIHDANDKDAETCTMSVVAKAMMATIHVSEAVVTATKKATAPMPQTQVGTRMMKTPIFRMPEVNMLPSQWIWKTKAMMRSVLCCDAKRGIQCLVSS